MARKPRLTREQLVADAVICIRSALSYRSKYALLDNICWMLSEHDGKYQGCRFWSRGALESGIELRHEHVVPRRVIISLLLDAQDATDERIRAVLQLCVGAVITKEEDQHLNAVGFRARMPEDWDGSEPFARYRAAGIELVDQHASLVRPG